MRTLLLASLALLSLAAPARAQNDEDFNPVIQVTYPVPVRAVYVAALDALEKHQTPVRMRLLDQALLTHADFRTETPGPGDTATVIYVELAAAGDSTQMIIDARVFRGDGQQVDGTDEGALTRVLVAETMIASAVDTALNALAAGAGGPDPREETDTYAYGRLNPVRVGGGAESGVANQRGWLDALRGPAGEPVRYRRLGSCCEFNVRGGGTGALDAYEVTYDGLERPVVLFLEFYSEAQQAPPPPEGFTSAPPGDPRPSR